MTYKAIIENIKNDKSGIAKGYSVSFLQEKCCNRTGSQAIFNNLITKDLSLFKTIEKASIEHKEPKDGDFVNYDGEIARIANCKNGTFQLSNKVGIYISENGSTQASGCTWDLDIEVERGRLTIDNLTLSSKIKKGECWTFSESLSGPDRGVYYKIDFKVWVLG